MNDAHRMLDACASVGADRFLLTFTDIDGQIQSYRPARQLQQLKAHLPVLMRTAEANRWNLIVPPRLPPVFPSRCSVFALFRAMSKCHLRANAAFTL